MNTFEFTFTQLLEEDYCQIHHHNKTGFLVSLQKVFWVQISLKVAILHPDLSTLMNTVLYWSI